MKRIDILYRLMSYYTTVLACNNLCLSQLLLDSLKLEDGYTYLFSSSPLTSPERSLPSSAASSPLSTPLASPISLPWLLAFPSEANDDDVPLLSMPPAQMAGSPLPTNPPYRSTRAKRRSHAKRKNKRKIEREASKLEKKGRKDTYKARSSTVKKHVKPANAYQTQFDTTTIPIASSGYVSVPGQKSSSEFALEKLVGPDSRFKMEKVVWDGR